MAETDEALAGMSPELVGVLVEELGSSSRRHRQDVSRRIAEVAKADPELLAPHVGALVEALYKPEAQTRWQVLDALTTLAPTHAAEVAEGFDGAEASLFDDGSAMVRLAAFLFLCALGATSPELSDQAWPLLDEAIQCYHGDAEYHDMLVGLLGLARGDASDATKKALVGRVSFDSKNGSGYIRQLSADILAACK